MIGKTGGALAALFLHTFAGCGGAKSASHCPCHGASGTIVLLHAGTCYLSTAGSATGRVTWAEAAAGQHGTGLDCMRHYTLAALVDAHARMAVGHMLRQDAAVNPGSRVRVALSQHGDGLWHWRTAASPNVSANTTATPQPIWSGEGSTLPHEYHTSAALHLDSGQLVTADVNESIAALWHAASYWSCSEFSCQFGYGSKGRNGDDTVVPVATRSSIVCERHCHQTHCFAYSLVPANGSDGYECILHHGYSSWSVELQAKDDAEFCSTLDESYAKDCQPLTVSANAAVVYSSGANRRGKYASGTVATVSCLNGTYFADNLETLVQTACDQHTGQWMYWNAAEFMCITLTKVWFSHTWYARWQEWAPGGNSIVPPQVAAIAQVGGAEAAEPASAYYRGYAYFIIPSYGYVYRLGVADYGVTKLADIASGYRRHYAGSAQLPAGRLLVCGGVRANAAITTCFVYWLESAAAAWAPSLLGAVRYYNGMRYYRGRVYTVGGWNGAVLNIVQSMDASALDAWRNEPYLQYSRYHMLQSVHVLHDRLYACTGHRHTVYTNTCEVFDGRSWSATGGLPRATCCGALVTIDHVMYYVAGWIGGNRAEISMYNETTGTWSDLVDRAAVAVHRHGAVVVW